MDDDDLRRKLSDIASYAHRAMWLALVAACCGIALVLREGGFF